MNHEEYMRRAMALAAQAAALSGKVKKCYNNITSYTCIHRRIELGSGL